MNLGILFCDSEKIIQTSMNSPINLENNTWYCELENLETNKLSKIEKLAKNVIWISNTPQTNSNIGLLQNWQSEFGSKVLHKEWLTLDLKLLMLKLGATLPKDEHLILPAINRLVELIEKYNGCEISLSTVLFEQIPNLLNTNQFYYENGLKNLKIPHRTWKQMPIEEFESMPPTAFILGIKPDSLIPKNERNEQFIEAVKLTFVRDSSQIKIGDNIVWINDCEYKTVSKYFHFYHNRSDLGTCISSCLKTGSEPNISLFHE